MELDARGGGQWSKIPWRSGWGGGSVNIEPVICNRLWAGRGGGSVKQNLQEIERSECFAFMSWLMQPLIPCVCCFSSP